MEECYPIVYRCCAGFKEHLRFHSYAGPRNDSENMYPIRCSFYKRQSREAFVQFCAAPRNEKNNIFPILCHDIFPIASMAEQDWTTASLSRLGVAHN
jgi:hypothetical protein